MNEEAIQYSYELFKKDGYEGSVEQYKSLIAENKDAYNHAYKLFKDDGYEGGESGFKGLVMSPPKEEEASKKATAVSTESPSDSAQGVGESVTAGSPSVDSEQPQVEGEDPIVQEIEDRKQEPNPEIVALYEAYKQTGEITIEDEQQVAQKVADQKKGEGRSWYETAGAYVDGWLRTGMPIPIYKYDTEEGLLEKRELARKSTFLESLPNEKREELNAYAVNRTLALDKASQNILAENSIIEEKAKLLLKNMGHLADAIKRTQESGKAVPQEMWEDYKQRKNEIEDISVKYNSNVDIIESNNEDIGSFVEELDLLKKNYTGIGYYKDLARLTTADMLSGIMEFGVSTAEMLPVAPGVPVQASYPEAEKFISEFREETQRQRSLIKPQLSIEDVEVGKNFGKWLAEQTMVQLPVLTTLAASGGSGAGLGILGVSSAGSKMGELKDYQTDLRTNIEKKKLEIAEMDGDDFIDPEVKANALKQLTALENKPSYGKAEIYFAGVGNGLAEILSEKVSLGILSKGKRVLKSATKSELKMGYKEYIKETADLIVGGGIDMSKEATSEFGNTLVQNAIDILYLGDEDTHILDGTQDALASGGAMGAGMSMFPSLIGLGSKALMSKTASDLMTKNSKKLTTLLDELEMGRETLPESTKKIMLDKVNSIIKEQDATLKEAFKRAKERSPEDNAKLIEIDKEANKIMKAVQDIKAGGLTPTMQADLLKGLKEKRDKLIEKKLEILEKKPIKKKSDGEAKVEDATETEQDTAEETTTTETDTTTTEEGDGTTVDEGTEGGKTVQGEDGKKSSVDGDGKGVQPDSDGDTGGSSTTVEGKKYIHPTTGREAKNQEELDDMRDSVQERIGELEAQKAQKINWDKNKERLLRGNKAVLEQIDAFSFEDVDTTTETDTTTTEGTEKQGGSIKPKQDVSDASKRKKAKAKVDELVKKRAMKVSEVIGIDAEIYKAESTLRYPSRSTASELKDARERLAELKKNKEKAMAEIESLSSQLSDIQGGVIGENGVDGKSKDKGTDKPEKTAFEIEKERIEEEKREQRRKKDRLAKNKVTPTEEKRLKEKAPRVLPLIAKLFQRGASLSALAEVYPKDSPFYPLIELMAKNKKNFSEISLRWNTEKETREGADGLYARGTKEIALNPRTRQAEHTIAHEAVHAVTVNAVSQVLGSEFKTGQEYLDAVINMINLNKDSKNPMERAVAELGALYLEVLENSGRMDMAKKSANARIGRGMDMYGFTNLYEFISEGMSNAKFQDVLNGMSSDVKVKADIPQTMFAKFVKAIGKILSAQFEGKTVIKDTALYNLIKVSSNIMKVNEGLSNLSDKDILKDGKKISDVVSRDDSELGRRERMQNEIDDMLAQGTSESAIINSYETKKEREIATDILSRKKKLTKEEAKAKLDATFDKAQKEMYEKKADIKSWNHKMRKLALWLFDRQYVPKMILKRSGLNLVRNYMITSKGASGYAKFMYDEAYKKIYQKTVKVGKELVVDALSSEDIKILDKMIMVRRIIAIDKNRAERGMPPVTQTGFLNGAESKLALEQMKEELGAEKFNDMNKRADAYFEAFQELLSAMEESGLVSKEFADKFFNVDYQPKVYLDFLKTAEQEMSIIEMGAEESTSLASEQVRSLEEGSAGSLITDSRYLLSRSMNARAKSVAMNNTVSKLSAEMEAQAEVVQELKDKDPKDLTAKEKRTIRYFNELSKAVKYNPIVGFTKSGKPKYKYQAGKGSHPQYYYRNGVRHMLIMEESFFDAFNDNVKGIWKNSNVKEKVAIASLSGLVKTIATGNNPAFFLTNAPRDFMFVATFSPVYGSVVPWNLVKIFGGMIKGIADIEAKNDSFRNFVKYGGMLDFLHKQGEFKGTSWTRRKLSTKNGKLLGMFGNRSKNFTSILGNALSFKKLQMWSEIGIRMAVFNQSVQNQFKAEGVKNEAEFLAKLGEEGATKLQDVYVNATAEARNTTDFSQGGIYAKDADALIPYLNAGIQGTRVAIEQLGANGVSGFVQTSLRMVQSAALLSAIPMAIGIKMLGWLGDDELPEEYKGLSAGERYLKARKGVSNYDQTNYSIWFTGNFDADGEAQYVRVAKPHFLTPFIAYAEGLQLSVIKKSVGDTTPEDTMKRVKWAVETNISPVELSLTGILSRNPILKASLTYTTGYDFYRDQDLSYLRGDVKVATEGHESKSVEAFYKTIGLDYSLSPARMKGAVESVITTPSTSPFIGLLYGGLDTILADEEAKKAMGNDEARVFKSLTGRLIKTTSEYNRRINFDKDFDKEISKLEIYDIKNKAKFKDLTKKLLRKEIDSDVLGEELAKLAKESPFDAKRMANIIKSTVKNPNVPQMVYQIKFATAKERALYLTKIYGGDFLDTEKEMSKENKKLWQALFTNKAINKETIAEYKKLIGK